MRGSPISWIQRGIWIFGVTPGIASIVPRVSYRSGLG
jgi:hypothetical protein